MRFYNRENELAELETLWSQVDEGGKLAVLTGRRRLGKTLLSLEFAKKYSYIYFFIDKKPESLLCQDLLSILNKQKLPFPVVGEIKRFKDLFELILEYAKFKRIILIVDEFQEFFNVNPSVYSEIQNLWDSYKRESKILFIAVGSVYSLMHKIFEDKKEPLFGRADRTIKLAPFSIPTLVTLLREHGITELGAVFDFYVLTGSVPKYLDVLMTNRVKSRSDILSFMLKEFSPFLEEGKNFLIEEFGKEYGTYFAILELLSLGKTSRPEIESIVERDIGGYIEKLEKNYDLIYRIIPMGEKPATRKIKYAIKDPFLNFWFRFIYRNRSSIELKNFEYVRQIIDRDYSVYCGQFLERFFREILALGKKYNRIGSYWEAKNLNEIDIVAINDLDRKILIAEVKTNPKKINLYELQLKAQGLLKQYSDYEVEWAGYSLHDAGMLLEGFGKMEI